MPNVIDRSRAEALIREQVVSTIFQDAPKQSVVMQLGRKLPNMTSKQTRIPVLSMLPLAYWVNGDTGYKQTSRQAWENVYLTAGELAVIVPIPEAVLADAEFDILGEVTPRVNEAIGLRVDQAILFGINRPAEWQNDIITVARQAGNNVSGGISYDSLLGENGLFAKVEDAGYTVDGINRSEGHLQFALDHGYIRSGKTHDFEDLVQSADHIIFALYPTAMIEWFKTYGSLLKPGCIFTDVSGVKTGLVEPIQALCPDGVEFIASHPMAGRETSSVEHAAEVNFAPANFIITPTEKNTPEAVQWARELAEVLGFKHICTLTVQEHDKMIGYVSQLCHAIAVSLMCANDNTSLCEYTGDSFRDLTRIARINDKMWAELFLWNKENLIAEIDQFDAALSQMRNALVASDRDKLEEMFRLSTQRRAAFDKKAP